MAEPLDVEQKTRLTWSQHVAFKAACAEIGIKQADVMRALILQFVRRHNIGKSLQSVGLDTSTAEDTD
jgi:hypothetical protein